MAHPHNSTLHSCIDGESSPGTDRHEYTRNIKRKEKGAKKDLSKAKKQNKLYSYEDIRRLGEKQRKGTVMKG